MDVRFLLQAIGKRFLVFTIVVLILVGSAFALNQLAIPQYQGKVSIVTSISSVEDSSTYNKFLASQLLTRTYETTIKSRHIASEVKESLQSPYSISQLLDKLTVRTDPGTLVIVIRAKDENAETAVNMANAFADSFIRKSKDIVESSTVSILDYADLEASQTPVSPNERLNLALAGFAGLVLGACLCAMLEKIWPKRKGRLNKSKVRGE